MSTLLSGFDTAKPASAPTVNVGQISGSLAGSSIYQYRVTFVTSFGETDGSAIGTVTTTSSRSVSVSNIAVSANPSVVARRLYRTTAGGSTFLLLAVIQNNTTQTFTDVFADGSLGSAIPAVNTAASRQTLRGALALSQPIAYSFENAITATGGGGQSAARQLTAEINVIAVVAASGDSVKLPDLASLTAGSRVVVINDGANTVGIFPAVGQNASTGTNTVVSLTATSRAEFIANSATAWVRLR